MIAGQGLAPTVTHRHSSQLSARCTAVTLLRMAQGITWRCRGMWCTCSACSRSAALMSCSSLAGSGSLLDADVKASSLSALAKYYALSCAFTFNLTPFFACMLMVVKCAICFSVRAAAWRCMAERLDQPLTHLPALE